jgi:spore photoproduct lyase
MEVKRIYIDRRAELTNSVVAEVLSNYRGNGVDRRYCTNSIGEPDFYERRRIAKEAIVLANRASPFIKRFHAPAGMICPGFLELNYGLNCSFNCHYCYLRLSNRAVPIVTQYVNLDKLRREVGALDAKSRRPFLLNSGELQDSLHIDHLTRLSHELVPYFAALKNARLLLVTKSDKVNNLLRIHHNYHTAVSFSLNSGPIIKKLEENTASLAKRIRAAKRVAEAGYEVRFRFDPLIPHRNWKKHYGEMIVAALSDIEPSVITLGTYRPHPALHARIIKEFPGDGFDKLNLRKNGKKMYYPEDERVAIYNYLISLINELSPRSEVGLCKETRGVWAALRLDPKRIRCNCLI